MRPPEAKGKCAGGVVLRRRKFQQENMKPMKDMKKAESNFTLVPELSL
jgi:hypothetical protein